MDMKYLKLIRTIVEEGNITKSANRLFLTTSALSHQLREFEEQIGTKVFLRSRNNWKLTEAGEEVYKLSQEVLDKVEVTTSKIQRLNAGFEGVIRLSAECYTFYHGFPAFIQKMKALYPAIDIQLKIGAGSDLIQMLLNHELDICLVTGKTENPQIAYFELFEDELFAIIHNEHRLARHDYLDPKDFKSEHLLIHSYPLETVSVFELFLKPALIEPAKISAIPMTEVTLELLEANMGIACFPKWALKSLFISDSLKFMRLGKNGLKRKHYLVLKSSHLEKPFIREFVNNLQEEKI